MGVTALAESPAAEGTIEVGDRVGPREWDAYVQRAPDASACHLAGWADVMRGAFGHRTRYLAASAEGRVVGILPLVFFKSPLFGRFVTSMPFLNHGGIAADTRPVADRLLQAAIAESRAARASYLELRHARRLCPDLAVKTHKVAMALPLAASVEEQWTRLDRKLRNQVRKAEKSGLSARAGGGELLGDFYDVLAENMRDLGTPVHGRRFFEQVLAAFPDRTRLFCVSLSDRPVAASFVIWHRDRIEVPWASSIRQFNPLCPNVLLYWEMLKFGIERGLKIFDFGRSTPDEGTYQFKKQWGAEPQPLYWEYWLNGHAVLPDRSPKNPKFSSAISLWQRLPVGVTRLVGPYLVRNIP